MTPDILRKYGTIDTISTLPVNEFPILVCKTRKTAVWTQNISHPEVVLKRPLFFVTENQRYSTELNNHYSHRRYEAAVLYNKHEQEKQNMVLPFVKGIKNLIVPEETFFIGMGEDGYPEPYRTQPFQSGLTFDSSHDFWSVITAQQTEVVRELIKADIKFNVLSGYHLDLIGFKSDHIPTLEEIAEVYKDPLPKATNLLFLSNNNIAWVDPKTSNLTAEKNLIRTILLKELLHKI